MHGCALEDAQGPQSNHNLSVLSAVLHPREWCVRTARELIHSNHMHVHQASPTKSDGTQSARTASSATTRCRIYKITKSQCPTGAGTSWAHREAACTSVDDAIAKQLPVLREGLDMLAAGGGEETASHKALCERYKLPKRPQGKGGGGGGNG